ncbi:hypothetical protein ASPZODRAFT_64978 [Penicilliopsis zonata CBS 506.65]|uniref:Restriction endonuclease type IV Mrr domain-containing protein n=1 Tax=Penicilliopsis zonata CBS 506.65 TaxID=1073090 RepID=A0A1L9SIZ4_9EURO|nr:hypothetical protein ASPZODRAFT_64978 [Penicilliopsis zonata CBS 506.65]OJJ47212.1 hypothetical protein ASPZODRAFT_64978 [Penicilliopsis zonata CBS 506.65]
MQRTLFTPSILHRVVRRQFSQSRAQNALSPFTRRLFQLPAAPSPPSLHHTDLASFLAYAERTALPTTSTTYIGTEYEYSVLQSLRRFAFTLHRVGGRDDAGIDLVGTWHIPRLEPRTPIRVIVQCKAFKTKLGPNLVRELEGAFRGSPLGWRTRETVGVLVSPREATKGVRDAMARSTYPLLWMMMAQDGTLRQALWNRHVEELGLGGLGVEARYTADDSSEAAHPETKRLALTWDGDDLPHMDQVEAVMARREAEWVSRWQEDDAGMPEASKHRLLDILEDAYPDLTHIDGISPGKVERSKILEQMRSNGLE